MKTSLLALLFLPLLLCADVPVTGMLAPAAPGATYPTHDAKNGLGGMTYWTNRTAFPTPRRAAGMVLFQSSDATYWKLGANLSTWTQVFLPASDVETNLRSTNNIVAWAAAGAYQPSGTITRNSLGIATSMAVKWPDGATGLFAGTANASGYGIDAYTLTYISGGVTNTVSQPTVTRDSAGNVTTAPTLTFQ